MATNTTIENGDAKTAFSKQSVIFDDLYANNSIVNYKRDRTRLHFERYLANKHTILELNAGTGQDAIYFSQKGYNVHATDVSEGMLDKLRQKVEALDLSSSVSYEKISFTDLKHLSEQKRFDAIFSNFGGLNCTPELDKVLNSFANLLEPEGIVTLVIMPHFCLWEFLNLFRGRIKLALRRFNAKNGSKAHIEGVHFLCWYYTPTFVIRHLEKDFNLLSLEGLCTVVPPSYMERFPRKYPRLWKLSKKLEEKLKNKFPFNQIGDYYIITLQKKN